MTQTLWDMTLAAAREAQRKDVEQTAAVFRDHLLKWFAEHMRGQCPECAAEAKVQLNEAGWWHDFAPCKADPIRRLLTP